MKTIVYFIRHSEPMTQTKDILNHDNLQIKNEKNPLSVIGEKKAEELSLNDEMKNVDILICSNYVRAISTAKYIAYQNNIDVNISEAFGERKFGINDWNEKPRNFDLKQIEDENYKLGNGESRKEVADRMYNELMKVLKENQGKRVAIVSHATAITFLFMNMFEYKLDSMKIKYNEKTIIDESFVWKAPEVFKIIYEDNELVSIENVRNFNDK